MMVPHRIGTKMARADLDLKSLSEFLLREKLYDGRGRLVATKFPSGQSNPTYLVENVADHGSQVRRKWVLRRKPTGALLPSAHAVDREFLFQRALKTRGMPVPEMLALCEDPRVIGSSFYVMEHLEGPIWKDPRLPACSPSSRRKIYEDLARSLARLHIIDATNLRGIPRGRSGKAEKYGLRTTRRWKKQYLASCAAIRETPLSSMMFLAKFLETAAPQGAMDDRECVLHGDFRMDNVIYAKDTNQVSAVLDWELATVGTRDQALADVAYACLPYYLPPTVLAIQTLTRADRETGELVLDVPPGVPSLEEFVSTYTRHLDSVRGRGKGSDGGSPEDLVRSHEWKWFVCLALFRVAGILAGVGSRAKAGNASAANAALVGSRRVVSDVIDTAIGIIGVDNVPSSLRFDLLKHKARIFCATQAKAAEDTLVRHASSSQKWVPHPVVETLKDLAKRTGLWNCFLSGDLVRQARAKLESGGLRLAEKEWSALLGPGLSNAEYMEIAEIMGRVPYSSEVFNCSAPDTGNMEVLIRHGTPVQCLRWLLPLLRGEIRSCFAMTEPKVASSDATNICSTIERKGEEFVLSGTKWWITGAMHPKCEICLFLGRQETAQGSAKGSHGRHTIVLVPMSSPGLEVVRPLDVFGFEDPPFGHAEVSFASVRVPASNLIHREGKGFEVAQARLGPGRLHHCARALGMSERALEIAAARAFKRVVFGKPIARHGNFLSKIAEIRMEVDKARLLVTHAAAMLDASEEGDGGSANPTHPRHVRMALAQAKVAAPQACLNAIDFAMQVHGAMGVSSKLTVLPIMWSHARTLRIADGPDDVHLSTISKLEIKAQMAKL